MRVLIFGGSGMLGHKLVELWREKFDVWTTLRGELNRYESTGIYERKKTFQNVNVANTDLVEKIIKENKPDIIINAVGLIKQLPTAKNVIETLTVNSIFPHHLAELAGRYEARLIIISTDCVFSGEKGNYTETDTPDALDLYGKSKNLGEVTAENCLTIRTSIIGRELKTAHSLIEWFLSNRGGKVKGYANAIYTGFPTVIFAEILSDLIENHPRLEGLFHISSEPINKYDLLRLVNAAYNARIEIEPFGDFRIDRSLDSTKYRLTTGFNPSNWQDMIGRMASDDNLYQN